MKIWHTINMNKIIDMEGEMIDAVTGQSFPIEE